MIRLVAIVMAAHAAARESPNRESIDQEAIRVASQAWNMVLPVCDGIRFASHTAGQLLSIEELSWTNSSTPVTNSEKKAGYEWKGVSSANGNVTWLYHPGFGWQPCGDSAFCESARKLDLILWKKDGRWSTVLTSYGALRALKPVPCSPNGEMSQALLAWSEPPLPPPLPEPALESLALPLPLPQLLPPDAPVESALKDRPSPLDLRAQFPIAPFNPPRPKAKSGSPVWLQVAALSNQHARQLAERLGQEGYPVITEPVPDKLLYRIIVGPVPPNAQAEVMASLTAAGFTPFVRAAPK